MQKKQNVHTKMKAKYAHFGPFLKNSLPQSVLFLVWGHYYTDFSIGGRDMGRWVEGG